MSNEPAASPKRLRKGRPILISLLVLALLPFGGVLIHRFVPVPYTLLMIQEGLAGRGLDYRWTPLKEISPNLVTSAIAAEDARFCTHGGFDMRAIELALKNNERGRKVRGGSTISQQAAKNVFLWPGRDWVRKGLEAGYTVLIETGWGKRRILEVYLNVAEMGPGVYGAEAAARHWFGKSAADLSPREAARIAAILPSPRRYDAATPGPYVRRRASRIQASARIVRNEGLADCVF